MNGRWLYAERDLKVQRLFRVRLGSSRDGLQSSASFPRGFLWPEGLQKTVDFNTGDLSNNVLYAVYGLLSAANPV